MKRKFIAEYESFLQSKVVIIKFLLGIEDIQPELLCRAFTGVEFAKNYNDLSESKIEHHDSLATFGDACLELIVLESLFTANPSIDKGELSEKAQQLVNNKRLDLLDLWGKINDFLLLSNNDMSDNRLPNTTIEALIGAIYLSNGLDAAKEFAIKFNIVPSDF